MGEDLRRFTEIGETKCIFCLSRTDYSLGEGLWVSELCETLLKIL